MYLAGISMTTSTNTENSVLSGTLNSVGKGS